MPRSGSTLTARILATAPESHDLGEETWLVNSVNALIREIGGSYPTALSGIDPAGWARLQSAYLQHLTATPARVYIDKYLETFLFAEFIPFLFPGAELIHTARRPEDVSMFGD